MDGGIYNTSTLRNSPGETTLSYCHHSLRKQPTFGDATHFFPRQMTSEKRAQKFHTDDASLDLGSASHWFNQISHAVRPIRSNTQFWVVTRHPYGISALLSQTSFGRETSRSVAKCRLFSQGIFINFALCLLR